jgi:hypothetical protein
MVSILSKAKPGSQSGARPPAAVELVPEGVLAAALHTPGEPPVYAFRASSGRGAGSRHRRAEPSRS